MSSRDPQKAQKAYRGWTIAPFVAWESGYKLPGSRSTLARAGIGTRRKYSGYALESSPDETGYRAKKVVDTLKEAREYIDQYEGEPSRDRRRRRRDAAPLRRYVSPRMRDAIDRFRSVGDVYAALTIVQEAERLGIRVPRASTIHQAEYVLRELGEPKTYHATAHIPTRLGLHRRDRRRDPRPGLDSLEAEFRYAREEHRSLARIEGRLTKDEYAAKRRAEAKVARLEHQVQAERKRIGRTG